MIGYIISVSLLIIAVIIIRAVFRKTVSLRVIYALWLVVVIRMVLPVTLFEVGVTVPKFLLAEENTQNQQSEQIPTPPIDFGGEDELLEEVPTPAIPITPIIPDDDKEAQTPVLTPVAPTVPSEPEPIVPSEPEVPPKHSISITPVHIINIIWLAGVAVTEAVIIFSGVSYGERLRKSRKLYKKIGNTKVYISESADVPCIAGIIPSIYITPNTSNGDSEELIIAHELCHIRHGDHIWSVVRAIALIAFWWNPLVWIAAAVSKQDAELACDEAVSSNLCDRERIKYANILIDTIPQKRKYTVGLGSAPMKERIIMLTTKQKNRFICIVLAVVLSLSAVGCSFASFYENKTTDTESETITPPADTEAFEPDDETELDTETENTDGDEIESYIAASGDGYVYTQPGGKLTILNNAGFECVKKFKQNPLIGGIKGNIYDVVIESGVTEIPAEAFAIEPGQLINKITINEGVTSIGDRAFAFCRSLERINIPDSVTSIGSEVFLDCSELRNVQLSDNVTQLGSKVFYWCSSLQNVRLPSNITEIKDEMFDGCYNLLLVDIPRGVTSIGKGAFRGCSLRQVILPEDLINIGDNAFAGNAFKSIQLPNTIISIGQEAFAGCDNLVSVDIPDSVTDVKARAFKNCTSLSSVTMGDNVEIIGAEAFLNCMKLTDIKFSKRLKNISPGAFSGCTSLESIELPYGVQILGFECFADCTGLKNINLPDSIKEVSSRIFNGCSSLTHIEIPKNMTMPEYEERFSVITNLKSAVIKDGTTRIGRHCFEGCANLETVEIPNSVKYIDDLAFHQCTSLKEIRFKGTEDEWNAIVKDDILWDFEAGDYTVIFAK